MGAKGGHLLFGHGQFHRKGLLPTDMNKGEPKIKVRIYKDKPFLKVSLTIRDDYCDNFESRRSPPSSFAFRLYSAKSAMLLVVCNATEAHNLSRGL